MQTGNNFFYHLLAIITVSIWGITFVSTKILISHGLTPTEIFISRFILAYIGIWLISPQKLFSKNRRDELLFAGAGLCGGSLYFITENTALGITFASNVSLIVCTSPLLTTLLSFLFYRKERLSASLIYGSLIALAGVSLVVFNGSFILKINPLGDILTLIAALMWAFYCIILKKIGNRYPTLFVTRKVFFYGIVTALPFTLTQHPFPDLSVFTNTSVIFNLLFLGIVASMLCYYTWNTIVKKIGIIQATNYIYINPLVTLVASAIILDETLTLISLFGAGLILLGVYLAERKFPLRKKTALTYKK